MVSASLRWPRVHNEMKETGAAPAVVVPPAAAAVNEERVYLIWRERECGKRGFEHDLPIYPFGEVVAVNSHLVFRKLVACCINKTRN